MRNTLAACAFCVGTTFAFAATAQTITFNFDTAPGGGAIASGTIVNTIYQSQGLTLSRTTGGTNCNTGNIFANDDRPASFTISSPPNVVSQCAPPQASDVAETFMGAIRADLASNASQVCINVLPDGPSDQAILRVYDIAAVLLNSATSTAGVTQTLCVSAANIRRAEFSGAGATYVRMDDLAVTFVSAPPSSAANIPALAPLLLAALAGGLGLLGARAARRR